MVEGQVDVTACEASMPALDVTPADDPAALHDQAVAFLLGLPEPWTPGPVRAHRLAPVLLDRLAATGWSLGPALARHLTARPGGVRSPGAVLGYRVRDLEPPETAKGAPPRPACRQCGSSASLVHGTGRCVRCNVADDPAPASDPAAAVAAVRAALRTARRAS